MNTKHTKHTKRSGVLLFIGFSLSLAPAGSDQTSAAPAEPGGEAAAQRTEPRATTGSSRGRI